MSNICLSENLKKPTQAQFEQNKLKQILYQQFIFLGWLLKNVAERSSAGLNLMDKLPIIDLRRKTVSLRINAWENRIICPIKSI